MKRTIIATFCLGIAAVTMSPSTAVAGSALENRVKQMEQELRELKALIVEQKQSHDAEVAAVRSEVSEAKQAVKESSGGNVTLSKGTTLSYGGYIKVNAMFDDFQDGATPTASVASRILVPSLVPVGGDSPQGTEFNSDVATSRFFFKTSTDTDVGTVRSYIELDFLSGGDERISNSNNSRLRHAYLAWDYADDASLLVGQTWSTFFNVGVLPESVEFIGPTSGTIFNRQTQIRWTKKLGNGSSFMLAAENPSTSLSDAGSGIDGNNFDDNSIPDIVARYNGKSGSHSYAFAALGREITADTGLVDESDFGFALNFSGKYVFSNGDDIRYSLSHGNLGRYIALNAFRDGGIDVSGNLDLTDVTGGYISYRHHWNSKLRSTIQYALATADLADGVSSANTEEVSNLNVNLLYSPTSKITLGGAIIQASRELENGVDGDLTRLQLTAKYSF